MYMKLLISFTCSLFTLVFVAKAQQRVVAECTVAYSISADSSDDKEWKESLNSSSKTIYIKGNDCRNDLLSPAFSQSTFIDKSTGDVVVLREFGNNKLMSKLSRIQWVQMNKKFDGASLTTTEETKTILGYVCKKALLQLKDGTSLTIYFTPAIVPSVKEFEYQFKDVPGFVLAYDVKEKNNQSVHYVASKISFNPVPASRFDIPTSGYRIVN